MDIKNYTEQVRILRKRIKRKRAEAQELRISASLPATAKYSNNPKIQSYGYDKVSDSVNSALALEEEANEAEQDLQKLIEAFKQELAKVEDVDDRDLLFKRYVQFKPWKVIATEFGYSESHTKRLHALAVKKLIHDNTQ